MQCVSFPFNTEYYKLVGVTTTEKVSQVAACRATCSQYGLDVMPLTTDEDRKSIVSLPNYRPDSLVVTAGVEWLHNGLSSFFSKQPGDSIDFVRISGRIGEDRQKNRNGEYTLNIYYHGYYPRDSHVVMGGNHFCACKRGELSQVSLLICLQSNLQMDLCLLIFLNNDLEPIITKKASSFQVLHPDASPIEKISNHTGATAHEVPNKTMQRSHSLSIQRWKRWCASHMCTTR